MFRITLAHYEYTLLECIFLRNIPTHTHAPANRCVKSWTWESMSMCVCIVCEWTTIPVSLHDGLKCLLLVRFARLLWFECFVSPSLLAYLLNNFLKYNPILRRFLRAINYKRKCIKLCLGTMLPISPRCFKQP